MSDLRDRLSGVIDRALSAWMTVDDALDGTDEGSEQDFVAQAVIDQLRTDEAIERVAQAIGEWEPEDWDNPEFREDRAFWTDKARTAINALLGEDQ